MPVYEYRCDDCYAHFDRFFSSINVAVNAGLPRCIACDSPQTRRCVSQVAQLRPLSSGVGRAAYPTSWTQTNGGDPETISYWKRRVEREMNEESRDPGLRIERERTAESRWNEFATRTISATGNRTTDEPIPVGPVPGSHAGHEHPHPHPHPEGGGGSGAALPQGGGTTTTSGPRGTPTPTT